MTGAEKRPKVLIVDDGDRYAELAHALLRDYDYATRCELQGPCWTCEYRQGCSLTHAHDWSETAQALAKHKDVDVVLLDIVFDLPPERLLPAGSGDPEHSRRFQGVEILRKLRRLHGSLPVILMTSAEELEYEEAAEALAVDEFATLAGADLFDARALGLLIERILERHRTGSAADSFLWGRSPAMAKLRVHATSLARTSLPVLLLGETGTGKSALAEQVLHGSTGRSGPFVTVDLSAIPETLVAAELFGTAPGAFSGAVDRAGCFERARGGTLFLDEIGNLPMDVQRMLLVSLESSSFRRLGETGSRPLDVKLIAATNADLKTAVQKKRFRADLYARLNPAAGLTLSPLRERKEDIAELARSFIRSTFERGPDQELLTAYMKTAGLDGPVRADLHIGGAAGHGDVGVAFVLSPRTLKELEAHSWPGNIRGLKLLMVNAAIFALTDALRSAEQGKAATTKAPRTVPIPAKLVRELLSESEIASASRGAAGDAKGLRLRINPCESLRETLRQLEVRVYRQLFVETNGDFDQMAARLLKGDPKANARRVRLRFNQLGLRARNLRQELYNREGKK